MTKKCYKKGFPTTYTIFPFEEYRVSLWFLQPFSIDIAGKTNRNPVIPLWTFPVCFKIVISYRNHLQIYLVYFLLSSAPSYNGNFVLLHMFPLPNYNSARQCWRWLPCCIVIVEKKCLLPLPTFSSWIQHFQQNIGLMTLALAAINWRLNGDASINRAFKIKFLLFN